MYNVNVKKDTTNLNIDRADLSDSLTTKVGILLILVATISLSFSGPVSMALNPQVTMQQSCLPILLLGPAYIFITTDGFTIFSLKFRQVCQAGSLASVSISRDYLFPFRLAFSHYHPYLTKSL